MGNSTRKRPRPTGLSTTIINSSGHHGGQSYFKTKYAKNRRRKEEKKTAWKAQQEERTHPMYTYFKLVAAKEAEDKFKAEQR
jgi:hypothetical protein